jgi:hypothetical protein
MAERRMFAKTIIDSDAFLDMSPSAQALYFHLAMRADDDGFVNNPKKIQRMVGASDDDCRLLIAKRFVLTFESGVIVIKHWRIHNYIRGDRKKETSYTKEMSMLMEKGNGAYSFKTETPSLEAVDANETKRQKAYRESNLPYSFEYKIKRAFWGCECPLCGAKMQENNEDGIVTRNRIPSIQHNVPISKGGKHELGNISVICKECNITLQDTETESLNAEEVIKKWDEICMSDTCLPNDGQLSVKCQHRLGKDRLGKVSIDDSESQTKKRFVPPTIEEVKAYCIERNNNVDPQRFIDHYTSNGWMVGKNKMKDWKASVRTWERTDQERKPSQQKHGSDRIAEMVLRGDFDD